MTQKYIRLDMGEPSFLPPSELVEYVSKKLKVTQGSISYSPPKGLISLRAGIAYWRKLYHNQKIEHDAVLMTIGGAGAIFVTLHLLARPASQIWIPSVTYPSYYAFRKDPSLRNICWFDASLVGLQRCSQECKPGSLVIFVNPMNPQGEILWGDEIEATLADLKKKGCRVVLDMSFEEIVYDEANLDYKASLSHQQELATLSIHSLSKTFSMAGWRVGYTLINEASLRRELMISQWESFLSPPLLSQWAAEAALTTNYPEYIHPILQTLKRQRDEALQTLPQEMIVTKPVAGYFLWLRAQPNFAEKLRDDYNVLTVSGTGFGIGAGDTFFRVNLAAPYDDLQAGIAQIVNLYKKLQ